MCNQSGNHFGITNLGARDITDKSVLEVGALNVNGSIRPAVEKLRPQSYVGIDLQMGPGVDLVCQAENLIAQFGPEKFDVIICTEVLEHVKNWKMVIHNLKGVLKPGGVLILTTRSKGFDYHGFPFDFWRFEKSDMAHIFSDFTIRQLENDPEAPGVFICAQKPLNFSEKSMHGYRLYSILQNRKSSVAVNNLYWAFICFPITKILRSEAVAARVMFYNAHPAEIPKLIRNKFRLVFSAKKAPAPH